MGKFKDRNRIASAHGQPPACQGPDTLVASAQLGNLQAEEYSLTPQQFGQFLL